MISLIRFKPEPISPNISSDPKYIQGSNHLPLPSAPSPHLQHTKRLPRSTFPFPDRDGQIPFIRYKTLGGVAAAQVPSVDPAI